MGLRHWPAIWPESLIPYASAGALSWCMPWPFEKNAEPVPGLLPLDEPTTSPEPLIATPWLTPPPSEPRSVIVYVVAAAAGAAAAAGRPTATASTAIKARGEARNQVMTPSPSSPGRIRAHPMSRPGRHHSSRSPHPLPPLGPHQAGSRLRLRRSRANVSGRDTLKIFDGGGYESVRVWLAGSPAGAFAYPGGAVDQFAQRVLVYLVEALDVQAALSGLVRAEARQR